jgi:hypothetical protein
MSKKKTNDPKGTIPDPEQWTTHHIVPRSRGGNKLQNNTCEVRRKQHEAYHTMFKNMTPDEILEELVANYWGGQRHWLYMSVE